MGIVDWSIAHLISHGSLISRLNFTCQTWVILRTFFRYLRNAGHNLLLRGVFVIVYQSLSLWANFLRLRTGRLVKDLTALPIVLHVRCTVEWSFWWGRRMHIRRGEVLRARFCIRYQKGRFTSCESWRHKLTVLTRVESLIFRGSRNWGVILSHERLIHTNIWVVEGLIVVWEASFRRWCLASHALFIHDKNMFLIFFITAIHVRVSALLRSCSHTSHKIFICRSSTPDLVHNDIVVEGYGRNFDARQLVRIVVHCVHHKWLLLLLFGAFSKLVLLVSPLRASFCRRRYLALVSDSPLLLRPELTVEVGWVQSTQAFAQLR